MPAALVAAASNWAEDPEPMTTTDLGDAILGRFGEHLQHRQVGIVQRAGLAVDDAQGAESVASGTLDGLAGVEPDVRLPGHQRVIGESPVSARIVDDEGSSVTIA